VSPPPLAGGVCHPLSTVTNPPLSKYNGGCGTTSAFSGWLVYLQFSWRSASNLLSCGLCHSVAAVTSFPLSKVAGWVLLLLSSPAGLFIYSYSGECPSPTLWSSMRPSSLLCVSFLFFFFFFSAACLLFSLFFSFLSLGGSQSVQGDADSSQGCLWSTMCCLAHLVVCFSQEG
jgi:hypothetical protein